MFLALTASAQSRFVTLTTGTNKPTDQLTIASNEVASIVCGGGEYPYLLVNKENFKTEFYRDNFFPTYAAYQPRMLIAGPATFRFGLPVPANPNYSSFVTIEIIPESFPPDKTIIIPADVKGANIIMEASPDLIHWTNAPPGFYTNQTGNLFFRLRAERIP